jgi:hypothetical protein
VIGRFLSGDPVGFSVDAPQMFNRYSYVGNDPVNGWTLPGCFSNAVASVEGTLNLGDTAKAVSDFFHPDE